MASTAKLCFPQNIEDHEQTNTVITIRLGGPVRGLLHTQTAKAHPSHAVMSCGKDWGQIIKG